MVEEERRFRLGPPPIIPPPPIKRVRIVRAKENIEKASEFVVSADMKLINAIIELEQVEALDLVEELRKIREELRRLNGELLGVIGRL